MDQVFMNTPWGNVTIKESWPQWQKDMWLAVLGIPKTFVPTFEPQQYVTGLGGTVPLNPDYFATEETAIELMKRFNADQVANVKYQGSGGTEKSTARERWLVFRDGTALNAGLLAAQFARNPEDHFPNVAANACWRGIDEARAAGRKLPTE